MAANCDLLEERLGTDAPIPCGTCATCRSIERGDHADVITVGPDPKRKTPTITVAQIREVVRQVGYHRYTGRRRFVIIDPAEAMAAPSANALLKTLEEPPDGTGFILIAHGASALLPTIVSRCQRVRFTAVPVAELEAWLVGRGHPADEARTLARLALGRPGAALALAEGGLEARQALRDRVMGPLRSGDLGEIFDLSKELCSGDRQVWVPRVEQLLELLEDGLRDATVVASQGEVELLEPDADRQAHAWADRLWPTGITRLVRAVEDAREGLRRNAHGRVVVDAVLVRFATELKTI